jgi:vacuolar-type H+-ATPase subunit H
MERDMLEEVLAVEKEIRARLEAARNEAGQWLAVVRREVEQQKLAELARLEDDARRQQDAAQETARATAAAIVQRSADAAQRIEQLADDALVPSVRRHLARIAPRTRA